MMFDPIANLFTKIRNATKVNKTFVVVQTSKIITNILNVMKAEGYIVDFENIKKKDDVKAVTKVYLKYINRNSVIVGIKQVSKPGLRVYSKHQKIKKILNGLGISIVSTPLGIITGKTAMEKKVGGEVIAYIW
ncbi:MAG: 30S ribosomal protein S8 [Mycoplasmataceae bacterium]|jgi:small subunit ribosomal protein S8|nr:30S ribosomal protein S8 [Mycoplasmataceae bacterium]